MRILYIVHQFFPKWYTGTERFVLNLAKQMQKMGHKVEILTYGINDDVNYSIKNGIMCKRYRFQGIDVISVRHIKVPKDIHFYIFDKSIGTILKKIITKEKFDIVHIAHPMRLGVSIKYANSATIPVVLTLTDFWLMCPKIIAVTTKNELCISPEKGAKCFAECYGFMQKNKILQRFEDAYNFIKNVDTVIAPTYFVSGIFNNIFNKKIYVIKHGIDYSSVMHTDRPKYKKDYVVFGFIGTILPHKGVHIILEALKLIKNKKIKLEIYGNYYHDTDYYNYLKNIVNEDNRIEFMGEYKDEEMPSIMEKVDCIIVPSTWWENSPLTILTSLAFRIPVITTNVGGASELVKDGINGFNFEIGNPKSLANVMKKIAENPDILNTIKNKIIMPPRIEEEAFRYEMIYSSLIGEKEE